MEHGKPNNSYRRGNKKKAGTRRAEGMKLQWEPTNGGVLLSDDNPERRITWLKVTQLR